MFLKAERAFQEIKSSDQDSGWMAYLGLETDNNLLNLYICIGTIGQSVGCKILIESRSISARWRSVRHWTSIHIEFDVRGVDMVEKYDIPA